MPEMVSGKRTRKLAAGLSREDEQDEADSDAPKRVPSTAFDILGKISIAPP